MKCGFCSFFCPVYQEEKMETSVARGKNYLVKQVLAGKQEWTHKMADIIGKCLLCKRCAANCPAKTQIDRVVVATRAQMVRRRASVPLRTLPSARSWPTGRHSGNMPGFCRSSSG